MSNGSAQKFNARQDQESLTLLGRASDHLSTPDFLTGYRMMVSEQESTPSFPEDSLGQNFTSNAYTHLESFQNRKLKEPEAFSVVEAKTPITNQILHVLQKWEGYVKSIQAEDVTAIICDLTDPSQPKEEVTFQIDEVSESDRELIQEGAVFYWYVGYLDSLSGQLTRASQFKFRRLPAWSSLEIERAKRDARELYANLSEK